MLTLPSLFPFFHTPATSPPSASLSRPFPCHLHFQNKFKMFKEVEGCSETHKNVQKGSMMLRKAQGCSNIHNTCPQNQDCLPRSQQASSVSSPTAARGKGLCVQHCLVQPLSRTCLIFRKSRALFVLVLVLTGLCSSTGKPTKGSGLLVEASWSCQVFKRSTTSTSFSTT